MRKSALLSLAMWAEIDALRRQPDKVVSEQEALRRVVRAGLDALKKEQGTE